MTYSDLGYLIDRRRRENGWTQKELADRLGVSLSTLQRLCRQAETPYRYRASLKLVLDIDVDTKTAPCKGTEDEKRAFIRRLTMKELRYLVGKFWDWVDYDNGCPAMQDKDYVCEGGGECDDQLDEIGCWVKYYIWKQRRAQEAGR